MRSPHSSHTGRVHNNKSITPTTHHNNQAFYTEPSKVDRIKNKYSRLGHLQWGSVLPLELTVHKDSVLAVAFEKEVLLLVVNLDMSSADEAGVAQMNVDFSLGGTVPSDHNLALPHQIFKLFPRYFGNWSF